MSTKKVRGGILLARALKDHGIKHVFTLSGGFVNPALEGLMESGLSVINCPHEQIAGHLADGYTRISRRVSVCLTGPEGFANAIPAMMEAWGERVPLIFITGSSTLKRQGSGGFKEIDDVSIATPLTKYSVQVTDGNRIAEFVRRAYTIATTGYPGPVHISIPVDIMFSSFDESVGKLERPFFGLSLKAPRAYPDPNDFDALFEKIFEAKNPIFIGGHGVWWAGAEESMGEVAVELGIPVFNVPYHQKLLDENNGSYMGLADIHQYPPSKNALNESDLVILVGGRLDNQMNFGNPPLFPSSLHLICVNGSHEELQLNSSADSGLLSHPDVFFKMLRKKASEKKWQYRGEWFERNRFWRASWVDEQLLDLEPQANLADQGIEQIHPMQLALDVQNQMSESDWFIFDGGNTHFWAEMAANIAGWRGQKLAGILHPGSYSLLGVGVSFAISAKRMNPEGAVILLSGDGAFLSGGLGLEVAFQEDYPIVVVIDNNGGLDSIGKQQERLFANGQKFATEFRDIPFHGLFQGMGGFGELVENRSQLPGAIKRAVASGLPSCVNVKAKGVLSPIVAATANKREKSSIE